MQSFIDAVGSWWSTPTSVCCVLLRSRRAIYRARGVTPREPLTMFNMARTQLQHLLRLAFGLGLLAWIAHQVELSELLALMQAGEPLHLLLGAGLLVLSMLGLQWTRLHVLIGHYTRSWKASAEIFYVGALFNNVLPSNLGGDAMRMLYLRELSQGNLGAPFMLMFAYRASSFVVLMLSGLLYMTVESERLLHRLHALQLHVGHVGLTAHPVLAMTGLVSSAFVLRALLPRMPAHIRSHVVSFCQGCRAAWTQLSLHVLASLMLQTVLFHACRILSFYFLVSYAGQHITLWDLVFVLWIGALANLLPISVAGFGVVEATIVGLLTMFGVDMTCASAVALVNRAVMLLAAGIGGVIYLHNSLVREPTAMFQVSKSNA